MELGLTFPFGLDRELLNCTEGRVLLEVLLLPTNLEVLSLLTTFRVPKFDLLTVLLFTSLDMAPLDLFELPTVLL